MIVPPARVLCVDLDGTLVRSDILVERILALAGTWRLWLCFWTLLTRGRAAFKHQVVRATPFDPALLPYDQRVVDFLRRERAAGRRIVLVTAADRLIAEAVAAHLGLFDDVMASDGIVNLKGRTKAEALVKRFGAKGFSYAGDSTADLPVWGASGGALLVNTSPHIAAALGRDVPVEHVFPRAPGLAGAMRRAMRPHQWAKNILVFVPLITAGATHDTAAWAHACLALIAFSCTASGIYIINDLLDLTSDRRHPRKRHRPFAAGTLTAVTGLLLAPALAVFGFIFAYAAGTVSLVAIYAILSLAYSVRLKEMPLVDVFLLAALYTIRLGGGGVATGYLVSLWLLEFSSFLFLSLALVKRVTELKAAGDTTNARRGYRAEDTVILEIMGCGAAFCSAVVLTLFVQSDTATAHYTFPALLWGLVPLILFWQCRLWLSASRGWMHDDPIVFATTDWVSWAVAGTGLGLMLAARLLIPPG